MARTVYFSFHYQRDIMRVQQVKNHYVTKENYTEAGYFDGSLVGSDLNREPGLTVDFRPSGQLRRSTHAQESFH